MNGQISVIFGTMFSGKSNHLMTEIEIIERTGSKFVIFSPSMDTRAGENTIYSRTGRSVSALTIQKSSDILDFVQKNSDVKYVFIDEAQFFDCNLPRVVRNLKSRGINITLAGLATNASGDVFGSFSQIIAIADRILTVYSVCNLCKTPKANMTLRKVDGEFCFSSDVIVDDGTTNVEYIPVCPSCFHEIETKHNPLD